MKIILIWRSKKVYSIWVEISRKITMNEIATVQQTEFVSLVECTECLYLSFTSM